MANLKDEAKLQSKSEPELRLEVVGQQFNIEKAVIKSKKSCALFVVPSLLTPMFIAPDAIAFVDNLYVLKKGYEKAIPDGLIPDEKANDPKQLSTVLARVLTIHELLAQGSKVVVMHVDKERKKADKKMGFVDKKQLNELMYKYPKNLVCELITAEHYDQYKEKVCAATYYYEEDKVMKIVGIDASQINATNTNVQWGVRDSQMQSKVDSLNTLLTQYRLPLLHELHEPIQQENTYW